MASSSSLYNEERNLLRIREWERRYQEALQDKEFNQENIPLFGEPYKTSKGDELSSRIQKMLGSYEDVNNPHPSLDSFTKVSSSSSSSSSSHVSLGRSSHSRPANMDKAKPPFQNQNPAQSSGGSSNPGNTSSSQSLKKLAAPDLHGPSSSYSQCSPTDAHHRKSEAWADLRECASLPPVLAALSPPAAPLSPLHSSDSEHQDTDDKDTPERHRGSPEHPESPGSAMEVSPLDPQRHSPPQASETTLLSQTFPPPLASKPPNLVMPQKPTAYVRPMDGQDQVANESPDLKPSPEGFRGHSYEPLPDLKSTKPSLSKLKMPPQTIETLSNEAHCVEDILREMTHSWPPVLTAIHTPGTAEPSKFSFPAKEAQRVPPAYPGQKHYGSTPRAPCSISQQSSSAVSAAHSSGVESGSSSDSESSSGSESDSESSESSRGEPRPPPLRSSPPAVKTEGVTVTTNWQLYNWIKSSQQNPSADGPADAPLHSPAPKPPPSREAAAAEDEEAAAAAAASRLRVAPLGGQSEPRPEGPPPRHSGRPKSPASAVAPHRDPAGPRKTVGNKHPSKPGKAPRAEDPPPQAGLRVESVEVAPRDKDPSFTDRPRVKTKTGHGKNGSGAKTEGGKKPAKRSASDKRKAESEPRGPKVTLVLDCKREPDRARSPSPSPRPRTSPARVEQPSPAPAPPPAPPRTPAPAQPAKISRAPTEGPPSLKVQKKPRDHSSSASPAPQPSAKRGGAPAAKAPRPGRVLTKALLVKIELSLLSRVPLASSPAPLHKGPDLAGAKRPPTERGSADHKNNAAPVPTKACKKRPADQDVKTQRKKPRLEKDGKAPPPSSSSSSSSSSVPSALKTGTPAPLGEERERKKGKKPSTPPLQQPPTPQDPRKAPGSKRHAGGEEPGAAGRSKDTPPSSAAAAAAKHKRNSGKRSEHSKTGKKAPKSSFAVPAPAPAPPTGAPPPARPLLKPEERQFPVEHHMTEAKVMKRKADNTPDKVNKAFRYLEAAMSFVESGIAMETDPQTPKSAYTMFAETVELIRFILKLKNSQDPSARATEKDFTVLCMRCQALLQMAMFRYKREAALKYSKTLTEHFKSSSKSAQAPSPCMSRSTGTPSPMSPMPSPASSSSGPGSNHSVAAAAGGGASGGGASSTVAIPQVIQQVAASYVNITALFLNAHDTWEQAHDMAPKGSGVLSELDSALGPLSLTSSMASLVRYIRQGLHWLRLDTRETH